MRSIPAILIASGFLLSCSPEPSEPHGEDKLPSLIITGIQPSSAYRSQEIVISGENFDSVLYANVIWFNTARIGPHEGSTNQLHVRIPYLATSGPVSVRTSLDSVAGPTFSVLEPTQSKVAIIPYVGPTITESDGLVLNPAIGTDTVFWTSYRNGDTLELKQDYPLGDDTRITKILRFNTNSSSSLPAFFEGYYVRRELHGTYRDTVFGLIQIQDWSVPGVVSGRVSTPWYDHFYHTYWGDWNDFTFWKAVQ